MRPSSAPTVKWSTLLKVAIVVTLLVLAIIWLISYTLRLTHLTTTTGTGKVLTEPFQNAPVSMSMGTVTGPGPSNGVYRYDPNAPEPVLSVSEDELRTYTSEHRNTPEAIYDDGYAHLYRLIIDEPRDKTTAFEVDDLVDRTRLREFGSKAVVLDVGCGTGAHLEKLADILPSSTLYGLDQSRAMLDAAEARLLPHANRVRFIQGDFNRADAVYEGMCTHLTCYYFSFYYATSSKRFFKHAHRWLQPKGYLVVHLVDPDHFDPLPEAVNPVRGISIQRYFDERKTNAKIILNNTDDPHENTLYTCDFQHRPDEHSAVLTESFIYPKERFVRRHTTELRMPHHEAAIQTARQAGFRLRHVTPLLVVGDEYEFLCYLQRED